MIKSKVKVIRSDKVESIQPLETGCHERWIFDKNTPTENSAMAMAIIEPGKRSGMHKHSVEECYYIIRGRGNAIIGEKKIELEPDLCMYAPAETPHNFINMSTCESLIILVFFSKNDFKTSFVEDE